MADLNDQQRVAVYSEPSRALLVLAGAGTGKTTTLCRRIAHVIESGIPPFTILAVTFTNKAAEEMRQRIQTVVGDSAKSLTVKAWFCTRCTRISLFE